MVERQGLTQWIRQHHQTRLDPSAVAKAITTLDEIHRSTDCKAASRVHVAAIHERNAADLERMRVR